MRTKVYDHRGGPENRRVGVVDGVDHDREGVRIIIPNKVPKAEVIAQLRMLIGEIRRSHRSPLEDAIERAQRMLGHGLPCPRCGSELRRAEGRCGPEFRCMTFPKCTYTEPVPEDLRGPETSTAGT